jgi:membrane protein implicated in regulation of membrane protease activity
MPAMDWWMWMALGFVLLVLELATPSGFFIMFFGLGAITAGLLAGLGVAESSLARWLIFTIASLGYLLLFRRKLQQRVQTPPQVDVDSLVGVLAVPQEPLEPGAVGRVEVRGSTWNARNLGAAALNPGQRCLVVSVDGLLLGVRPE